MRNTAKFLATSIGFASLVLTMLGCGGGDSDAGSDSSYTSGQDGNYYMGGYLEVCNDGSCTTRTPAAEVDVQFDSHISERLTLTNAEGYYEIAYPTWAYDQLPQIVCLTFGNSIYFTKVNGTYVNLVPDGVCFNKSILQQGDFDRRMYAGNVLPKTEGTRMGIVQATTNDVLLERSGSGYKSTIIHLGDASFGGSANSELQAGTQGSSVTFNTRLPQSGTPIPANAKQLCVEFLARGIQTSSGNADTIVFGGMESWARSSQITLSDSPEDGGFGTQFHCIDLISDRPSNARISSLSITIRSGTRSGTTDLDDFEFLPPVGRFR